MVFHTGWRKWFPFVSGSDLEGHSARPYPSHRLLALRG
jgi:hypothetical protein